MPTGPKGESRPADVDFKLRHYPEISDFPWPSVLRDQFWMKAMRVPVSRFHNLSDAALADELGRVDSIVKAAEAELTLLKNEFKARTISEVAGEQFIVTATEKIAGRLGTKAVKAFLGESYVKFEQAVVSTVIRIKAANWLALAA
jgi:hypothetical protein